MNPFAFITAWLARDDQRATERASLHHELIEIGRNRAQTEQGKQAQSARVEAINSRLYALRLADIDARLAVYSSPSRNSNRVRPMSFQHAPEASDITNRTFGYARETK